jgi:hypothetical protein
MGLKPGYILIRSRAAENEKMTIDNLKKPLRSNAKATYKAIAANIRETRGPRADITISLLNERPVGLCTTIPFRNLNKLNLK